MKDQKVASRFPTETEGNQSAQTGTESPEKVPNSVPQPFPKVRPPDFVDTQPMVALREQSADIINSLAATHPFVREHRGELEKIGADFADEVARGGLIVDAAGRMPRYHADVAALVIERFRLTAPPIAEMVAAAFAACLVFSERIFSAALKIAASSEGSCH